MDIIDGNQRKGLQIVELILTLILWVIFLLLLALLFPIAQVEFLNANTSTFLRFAMYLTILSLIITTVLLGSWSIYNKKKFGDLKKRNMDMPPQVKRDELAEAFQVTEETVAAFQSDEWIEVDATKEQEGSER
ncbi:MAG: poly-beta-1,6-N-acetyl-D-glucosamine biosynthesis protein PgaD [Bacillus sp. (in: Bacteria)]|nr:poly-beta-1,6-N-acetyl-D-glucosamine biosynthesis protein PgaD [Bacillus sp. (in: firmicutes)]